MKRFFLSFLFLFYFIVSFYVPVLALQNEEEDVASQSAAPVLLPPPQTPINLTLSPISIVLETKPGEAVNSQIRVRNNSSSTEQLRIQIGKFAADPTGAQPRLLEPTSDDQTLSWIQVDTKPFEVGPGEWKTIPISFDPPQTASLSYYYSIFFRRAKDIENQGGDTVVTGAPAILMLTTVQSPFMKRELQVTKFSAKRGLLEYLPQEFTVEVRNSGNVHLAPSGNIFIDGQGQKDLAVLSINPTQSMTLPQTTRAYQTIWDDGFPRFEKKLDGAKEVKDSNGNQAYTLKWDFSNADKFRFGRFTAHLLLVYDNGERDIPIESYVSFWVIPWKLLLILGAIIVLVVVGIGSLLYTISRLLGTRSSKVLPPSQPSS